MYKSLPYLTLLLFLLACKPNKINYVANNKAISEKSMMVSAHPLATKAGKEIMNKGGNAVDAAIAIQFALSVVCPRAGNLGGGGFLLFQDSLGVTKCLDFREKAPKNSERDMFLDPSGEVIPNASTLGHLAVGVPGSVHGLLSALKYGVLKDLKTILAPSIKLAEDGFTISASEAARLNKYKKDFEAVNDKPMPFIKNSTWTEGDLLIQTELAETLGRIALNGIEGFYKGETAEFLLKEIKENNGIITQIDLDDYESIWRKPINIKYKDYTVQSMPPPSSGGLVLGQMLTMLSNFELSGEQAPTLADVHLITEIERRAYADRAKFMGDMDFYPVPIDSLLAKDYLFEKTSNFERKKATPSDAEMTGNFQTLESYETTHTSVIDAAGNAVSVTTTLNANYGSKVYVDGAGFLLNNEMDDFSARPGHPNMYGLIGGEANAIEPEKRMLSSMTPTIINKNGKVFLVLGTPGGSTIITSVFQVFIYMAEYGMDLESAVEQCRFHHQWLPDKIQVEENCFDQTLLDSLAAYGHNIEKKKSIGKVKAIHRSREGVLTGVGDYRNLDDHAEGG